MFSIEGLDVTVPMLDEIATLARQNGAEEVVIGMAHRGRLAVLAHNLGRSVESILAEFEGAKALDQVKAITAMPHSGTGDVKYHHGAEGLFSFNGDQVKVRLYPNPSHLEFVDPVVTGGARAAQTEHSGPKLHHNPHVAVPVLLHGDAAFPGQGVVAETLNLQSLAGYKTGGTIHLITDNQVGFTTDPTDDRSTPYAGDMAKGFNCPIIHVNADDVEACVAAIRLAMAYREQWGRDVVIDLIGYRRYGHNETDEPAYTQPRMAAQIKDHPPVSEIYAERLVDRGRREPDEVVAEGKERLEQLQGTLHELRAKMEAGEYEDPSSTQMGTGELDRTKSPEVETAVSEKRLRTLNEELLKVPDSFTIHRKLRKPLLSRVEKLDEGDDRVRARRGARVRLAAHRGHPHPAHRPGHRARHVLAPPPGPPRREHGPALRADPEPLRGAGAVRAPQQPAVGGRLPGLRVRLLGRLARVADPLGGAVRRLRQLRAGDHRPVHRRRRVEVGPDDAAHPPAPARLRGRRPRALERPDRALHPARLRGQHPARQPDDRGPVLPPPPPPGADRKAAAARGVHAQGPAAAEGRGVVARGAHRRGLPAASSTTRGPSTAARRSTAWSSATASSSTTSTATTGARPRPRSPSPGSSCSTRSPATSSSGLIASYPNLKKIVWAQEEPKNMGAWSVMARRLPELLPDGVELQYIGRPQRSSPSEGYPVAHRLEQERIVLTALEG